MRKMTMLGLLLAGVVALGCGAAGTDEPGSAAGNDSNAAESGDDKKKATKIGEPARDGKFEFTVKTVKCGVNRVGGEYGEKAQGQFCLVTVKVKNIGKEPQTFSDSSQKGFAADGTEYSTDTGAGIYANEDAATLFNEINPGNQVTGVLVFDLPNAVKLTRLELHDSPFSGGVTVALS